ncbi:outer membrane protein assembly factor BamB [Thioalbus denitrificans]|uniref:Outer membrane protein assembly factor BamB n=1 Tax=Thioalbus denitrificans TaxID=547122 RepID=A0A369CCT0_9GAMM|nr:outer membrane protein assembly factor BamB [Thioalbus denitrificans]RCX31842.1 Beta-barrel assembly machine subunit BamB [Thioalbus denitrificans]
MKRLLTLFPLFLLLGLGGCSTVSGWMIGEDNAEPPTPLEEFPPERSVATLWSANVGDGIDGQAIRLLPAVGGGRVYMADANGLVVALNAENGREVWRRDLDTSISGGVGLGEGLVLVGTSDAEVIALDADNGNERWRARVSSEVLAAPQAGEGRVVVQTIDGKLWGLGAADGARTWIYDRGIPVLTLRGTSSPVLARGAAIAGFATGRLVAVLLEKGDVAWERSIAIPRGRSEIERMVDIDAEPVVVGNTVYVVTYQGRVAALNLFSGEALWEREMSSYSGLGANERMVYVTDENDLVWGLEDRRGSALWRQDKLRARRLTAPVVVDGAVVVGDFEGYLHWMSSGDGHFLARNRLDDRKVSALVAVGNTLYAAGADGELAAFRLQ